MFLALVAVAVVISSHSHRNDDDDDVHPIRRRPRESVGPAAAGHAFRSTSLRQTSCFFLVLSSLIINIMFITFSLILILNDFFCLITTSRTFLLSPFPTHSSLSLFLAALLLLCYFLLAVDYLEQHAQRFLLFVGLSLWRFLVNLLD